MLDSILSHDIKNTKKSHFWHDNIKVFCHLLCNVIMDVIT